MMVEREVGSGKSGVGSGVWALFGRTRPDPETTTGKAHGANRRAQHDSPLPKRHSRSGFTLIELLVVMAVVALLLSIAAPRYFGHVERAKENTLRQSLGVMRDAIDKFQADRDAYPESLDELVERSYLRALPKDPYTDSASTWVSVPPAEGAGVADIHSGAEGQTRDGTPLGEL